MMDAGDEDSWYSPVRHCRHKPPDSSLTCFQKAVGIKWGIVGALILIFVLWIVGGYYHAKRRIAKGLPPLAYHRVRKHRPGEVILTCPVVASSSTASTVQPTISLLLPSACASASAIR